MEMFRLHTRLRYHVVPSPNDWLANDGQGKNYKNLTFESRGSSIDAVNAFIVSLSGRISKGEIPIIDYLEEYENDE